MLIMQENSNNRSDSLHVSKVVRHSKRVPKEKGMQTAEFEGFIQYIETSALFGEGVKNVFDEAIHAIIKDQSKYSKDVLGGSSSSGQPRMTKKVVGAPG